MMTNHNNLLSEIAQELNIIRGSSESEVAWKARIVYSAIGQMAIASLYDILEENIPISILHFKKRIKDLYYSYISVYPEIKTIFNLKADELSDYIYDILLQSGCIYHSPNRIAASAYREACGNQVIFIRGNALNKKVFRSGLGAYLYSNEMRDSNEVNEMFCLHNLPLSDYWNNILSSLTLSEINFFNDTKYLRKIPPFTYGYFKDNPDIDGSFSILRTGFQDQYLYYIYTYQNKKLLGMQLPSWYIDNNEYRILSNSCIYSEGHLPPTEYYMDQNIVTVKIQYLYPPEELNMIKLYGWPLMYSNDISPFKYVLSTPVFLAIKSVFEKLGYKFVEVTSNV